MKKNEISFIPELNDYILSVSLRENEILRELRDATNKEPDVIMQIPPEQGQFMAFLLKILNAKKVIEIGTYTGYSTLCIALSLPSDGKLITCDVNKDWANIAIPFWKKANLENIIDLKIAPALDTLNNLIHEKQEGSFDFIFIDADKSNYDNYYEKSLTLLKTGGLIAIDNVLLFGSVISKDYLTDDLKERISDVDIESMRNLNLKIKDDDRVELSMLPIADGLTLVRKK